MSGLERELLLRLLSVVRDFGAGKTGITAKVEPLWENKNA
jgi:hypothetical protein